MGLTCFTLNYIDDSLLLKWSQAAAGGLDTIQNKNWLLFKSWV